MYYRSKQYSAVQKKCKCIMQMFCQCKCNLLKCSIVQVQVCKHISWSSRPRFGHYQRGRPSLLLPWIIVIFIIFILIFKIVREDPGKGDEYFNKNYQALVGSKRGQNSPKGPYDHPLLPVEYYQAFCQAPGPSCPGPIHLEPFISFELSNFLSKERYLWPVSSSQFDIISSRRKC